MQQEIEKIWQEKSLLKEDEIFREKSREKIEKIISDLNKGKLRVAVKVLNDWQVNEWVKKAILLYIVLSDNKLLEVNDELKFFDKVPLKFHNWQEEDFTTAGFRVVPGAIVRRSAFIENNCIIMPSFVNLGAYIGEGTLIDSYANVGSCAQIGKNCHISMNVGIGGVLEPLQAHPVIIEDNVFIGAASQIVEGVLVEEGAVIGMGVTIGASTKIYDRATSEVTHGKIPAYSVVVPGVIASADGATLTNAAIIVKKVDAATRSKTAINDLLRG